MRIKQTACGVSVATIYYEYLGQCKSPLTQRHIIAIHCTIEQQNNKPYITDKTTHLVRSVYKIKNMFI